MNPCCRFSTGQQSLDLRLQMTGIPTPIGGRLTLLGPETDDERLETEMLRDPPDGGPDDLAGEFAFVAFVEEIFEHYAVADKQRYQAMIEEFRLSSHFLYPISRFGQFNSWQCQRYHSVMEGHKVFAPYRYYFSKRLSVLGTDINNCMRNNLVAIISTVTVGESNFAERALARVQRTKFITSVLGANRLQASRFTLFRKCLKL